MTVLVNKGPVISYELLNRHERRTHIRSVLLQAATSLCKNYIQAGAGEAKNTRPPFPALKLVPSSVSD